jgi:TPR repeat protein
MLCFGEGITPNYLQGLDWLKKSAEHGNAYAENLYRKVNQQFRQQLISASLSLLRGLAMMLARRGEEQYQSVDWTDSRLKEEMDQKKYATGFSMHM